MIAAILEFRPRPRWDFPSGHVYLTLLVAGLLAIRLLQGNTGLVCPLKSIAGIPCLTCGSTRALFHISHFEFLSALQLNPGMVLFGLLLTVYFGLDLVAFHKKLKPVVKTEWASRPLLVSLVLLGLILNWAYLITTGV